MANVYTKLNSFALLISYMKRRKPWACFCREEKRTFPNLGRILACLNYEVLVYTRTALWQEGSVQDLAVWGSVLNSSTSEPLSNLPILKQEWNCEWLKHTDSGVGESTTVLTLSFIKPIFFNFLAHISQNFTLLYCFLILGLLDPLISLPKFSHCLKGET